MPRQTSFNAGELSPLLWGRSDRPEFAKGARSLKNFFVSREGPAVSRPGTLLVREAKNTAPFPLITGPYAVRLVPFVIADDESYVLEFGHNYIRFHRNGATLLNTNLLATSPTTGTPLEVVTDYTVFLIGQLQFAQVGNELHIVHPSRPERILSRSGVTWSLDTEQYMTAPRYAGQYFIDLKGALAETTSPRLVDKGTTFVSDAAHPPREWLWVISSTVREIATGKTFETTAVPVTKFVLAAAPTVDIALGSGSAGFVVLYPDAPITLLRRLTGSPDPHAGAFEGITYNYYRGRGGIYGYVGSSAELEFTDNGVEPDYVIQPLLGELPLRASSGALLEFASTIGLFQERRVLAGSTERPTRIIASATGNYNEFDKRTVPTSGMSLEFDLATRYRESIRWLLGQRQLLIGTNASIWSLGGTDSEVLDYDSVYARPIDNVGTEPIQPITIGNTVLYVRTKGRGVRALVPAQTGYEATDVSQHAAHLFTGGDQANYSGGFLGALVASSITRQVTDWCYAEDPWGVAWVVRDDGVLLSMTLSRSGEAGWAQHKTDGDVIAVCAAPESGEDGVYLAVTRTIGGVKKLFIERMTSRVANDSPEDDACVDCAIRFQTAPQLTYTGLGHLEGKQVYAVAVGNVPYGPFTVTGGSITLPELPTVNLPAYVPFGTDYVVMFIGLGYTCELETLDYVPGPESRMRQKSVSRVGFEVYRSRGLQIGQDFNHLIDWRQRTVGTGYGPSSLETTTDDVAVTSTFDKFARAVLRQTLPLPVIVLAITREVDAGG